HVAQEVDGQRDVGDPRDGDRLAVVERLELRELLRVLLDEVRELPEQAAALGRRRAAPRPVVERRARRAHRAVDVFAVSLGGVREPLARGGGVRGEGAPRGRVAEAPADQERAAVADEVADLFAKRDGGGHRGILRWLAPRRAGDAESLLLDGARRE